MAEVDLVIGNADKMKAEAYRPLAFGLTLNDKVQVNDIMSVRETAGHMIDAMDGRARAFVQVQNGCDHRCTFCIIPYGRGPTRSVPMGLAVEQIKRLAGNGLTHCIEIPYKVAINEAVELAKSFGGTDGHKYVNGVLDKVAAALSITWSESKKGS